jgi:SpoVK/Ycf46/Vps4 family AAA+-type ATPase
VLDADSINARDLGLYRLKGIQQPIRLFEVVHGKEYPDFPPLNVPAAFVHFLPTPPTQYYGREAEIEDLARLLAPPVAGELRRNSGRLVTLHGPGGTGKTRLALEVARRLLPAYLNAVWFVSLAELRDPELILDRLRETLGLAAELQRTILSQIAEYLGPQPCLLVLDNLEQLLPGAAETVSELLSAIPSVACLVTSRVRVNLSTELGYPVVALPSPHSSLQRRNCWQQRPRGFSLIGRAPFGGTLRCRHRMQRILPALSAHLKGFRWRLSSPPHAWGF